MLLGNAPHPYQLCLRRLSLFKMSFVLRAKLSRYCTSFTLELIGLDQWFTTGFALGHRLYIGYEVVIVFHTKSVGIKDKYVKWKIYFELRLNLGNIILVGWTCNTVHDITTSRSLHRDDNVIVFQNMHF